MLLGRKATAALFAVLAISPAAAQSGGSLAPDDAAQLRRYTECMSLARSEPKRALTLAESWSKQGGGLGARHCAALALFEGGQQAEAAGRFEEIERAMGEERPGLRAELLAQAGQAWMAAGQPDKAVSAQSRALNLKTEDVDLWVDRGLSYAMLHDWPHAIADLDHALGLHSGSVEILVLRAAARRNSGDPGKAQADADLALKIAPDNTEALLERGFARLAQGDRAGAEADFKRVVSLVPPDTEAGRRAAAGLQGEAAGGAPTGQAPAGEKR